MNKQVRQAIVWGSGLLLTGIFIGWGLSQLNRETTVYVNSAQVFSEFHLTKELNGKLSNTQQSRQAILDSMKIQVRSLDRQLQRSPRNTTILDSLAQMADVLRLKSEQFQTDNQRQLETYNQQIWAQLNQYIQDYRQEQGYSFVLGATGNGNVMAAMPDKDITEAVIAYVNERYAGS